MQLVLAFAAIYLIWGSTYLAIRIAIETLPPFLMAGSRFLLAGALLYVVARYGARMYRGPTARAPTPAPTRQQWMMTSLLGLLFLGLGNGGVVWAEQRVPSGLAALLVSLVPIWVVLVEWLGPGGRPPRAALLVGLFTGFAGVALLVVPGHLAGGASIDLVGAAVLVMSSVSWAVASVTASKVDLPGSAALSAAMQMLAGGAVLTLAGLVTGEAGRIDTAAFSLRSLVAVGYLVVFGSLIAFSAFAWLLRATTPTRVATYAYVNPVVAVLLGWALAGEPLSARNLVAAAIIVAAVALVTTARGHTQRAAATPKAAAARG